MQIAVNVGMVPAPPNNNKYASAYTAQHGSGYFSNPHIIINYAMRVRLGSIYKPTGIPSRRRKSLKYTSPSDMMNA